ncbi:MAG TPA: hypothetical protein VNA87_04625 [Actinomycetota bacterium]|nr:hypothetical protein [Actinomycetota bacterium]
MQPKTVGIVAIVAGLSLVIGFVGSSYVDPLWAFIILGVALTAFWAVPGLHRVQNGADGSVGRVGTRIVMVAGGLMVTLGLIGLVVEEVVKSSWEPEWVGPAFAVFGIALLIGFVLFGIGIIKGKALPAMGAWLLLVSWPIGIIIDVALGKMDEEDGPGGYVGSIGFALGLIWLGWAAMRLSPADGSAQDAPAME